MLNMQKGTISSNGIGINYYRTGGEKAPVLLVHGVTESGLCWPSVVGALAPEYDVVAMDLKGHGESDKPEIKYLVDDLAVDAANLIRELALDKPVVIGHSLGGAVAGTLAAKNPELVTAVVLEDPSWYPLYGSDEEEEVDIANNAVWKNFFVEQQKLTLDQCLSERKALSPGWADIELQEVAKATFQATPEVFSVIGAQLRQWPKVVPAIQCPALLLSGEAIGFVDGVVTPETAEEMTRLNDRIEHVHITGVGHYIRRDDFDQFMSVVTAFLRQNTGSKN